MLLELASFSSAMSIELVRGISATMKGVVIRSSYKFLGGT